MKRSIKLLISFILWTTSSLCAFASPELIIYQDDRNMIEVAEFGFLPGGRLSLSITDLSWTDVSADGVAAIYIRKGWILKDQYTSYDPSKAKNGDNIDHESSERKQNQCFLDYQFIKDEKNDGASIVELLPESSTTWEKVINVEKGEQGIWQVLFVSCKESPISFKLNIEQVNPGGNYLSAGDIPLPFVYAMSSFAYFSAAIYWAFLLVKKDTRVFRAHWLMFVLLLIIVINKALQSAKYHYMRIGLLTEGWLIGFYVFASMKGALSLLIIVLLASGWMFIKPFISSRDKRIISVIIPLQVLANISSAIGSETALGSKDWTFWNVLLPLVDIISCGIVLWTILQTRKHLASSSSVDGKEQDILKKYKLWSTFYVVTLVYIYITRVVVAFLQAALPFQYVNWLGEAVNEVATLLFYVFIGYRFRPYSDNPYIQVPLHEVGDYDEDVGENVRMGVITSQR